MSLADQLFIDNCKQILSQGTWDTDQAVRPRWEDGSPAHTIKCKPIRPEKRVPHPDHPPDVFQERRG